MIIELLVILAIVALIYWAINTLTLPPPVKSIAIVIVVVVACLYLLQLIGGPNLFVR